MAVRKGGKAVDLQVKECVKVISDEDLRWLSVRFKERVGSDLSEALVFIQEKYHDLNRVLLSSLSSDAVFSVADAIDKFVSEELKRRTTYRPPLKKEKVGE
jgi:hypothetical protein